MKLRQQGSGHSFFDILSDGLKYGLCYIFLLLLFVLPLIPVQIRVFDLSFLLIGLFYWSLFRPSLLPLSLVFIAGLATDIVYGYSIGLYAVLYLMVALFLRFYRGQLANQSFLILWLAFILVQSFIMGVELLYSQIFLQGLFPIETLSIKMILTALAFPFVNMLLFYQNRLLSRV